MQLKPRLVIPQITDTSIEHPQGMRTQNNSPSCNVTNLVLQSMLILQFLEILILVVNFVLIWLQKDN